MSYFSYTNNTQAAAAAAAAAGYNSMSNGATYQAPAYGSYQQQQPVAAATTPAAAAYIASSNQQTTVPAQYALSYAQPQQAQQTAVASGNTVANTAQQQTYQQSSYYSTPAPTTPTAQQFSKPASYYHQSQQQSQYYNTGTVVMKEATQPQQQSYTVESSTYTNNLTTQQQQTAKQLTKTSLMTQGAVTAAAAVANTGAAGVAASAMQVMKPPQPPATTTTHHQQQQHRAATQQHHTMTSQQAATTSNHHQQQHQVHHNTTQHHQQHNQHKMLHQLYHQQQQGGHHHHHQGGHHQQGHQRQTPYQLGNLPYWKQKRMMAQQSKDPNKPIQASEIKAYLYAWLGRFRSRPDYTITPHSLTTSRIMYVAEMIASGYAYIGKGCAGNKKDAQTRAAWDFCDYLVRECKINKKDLPTREEKFEEAKNRIPSNYKPIHYKQDDQLNKVAVYAEAVIEPSKPAKKAAKQQQQKPKVEMSASDKEAVAKAEAIMTSSQGNAVVVKPLMSIEVQPSKKGAAAPTGEQKAATAGAAAAASTDENSDSAKQGSVGESYVEQIWTDGRVVRYRCNLCECEFNDHNTKESHVRGRRHRLNYKQKVDPTIVVEIKLNQKQKSLMMQRMQAEKKNREHVMEVKKHREWRMYRQDEMSRAYEEDMMRHQYLRGNGAPPHMGPPPLMYEEYRRRGMPIPPPHMRSPHGGAKFHQQKFSPRFNAMKAKDDELVMMKHNQIYPKEEELSAVQKLVQIVESSLKQVSEKIHEEEMIVFTASSLHNQTRPAPERLLKSVLRIGSLAKGLLLHANLNCQLVLVCKEKPTRGMLKRVAGILPSQLQSRCEEMKIDPSEYVMEVKEADDEIVVKSTSKSSPQVVCNIYLTSPVMRQQPTIPIVAPKPITTTTATDAEKAATAASDEKDDCKTDDSATQAVMPSKNPPDMLDRKKCCQLLASLRHVKWFQLRASGLQSCVIVIRLMKDFCTRVPTWRPLSSWAIELLVQTVISSSIEQVTPYMGMLLVFKAISSGILLEDGAGLLDPCERERSDVVDYLSLQQREDITSSAQHALRLMAFGSTFEVLGLDEPVIEVNNNNNGQQARKRPLEAEEDSNKKAKTN